VGQRADAPSRRTRGELEAKRCPWDEGRRLGPGSRSDLLMSQRERKGGSKLAEGISTRHSRSCAKQRGGERCSCRPVYIPWVFHPGKNGKVYGKRTKNQAEAKAWRVDALRALNQKTLAVPTKQTVKQASRELLEAMESGQVRNRSGDAYKPSVVRSYRGSLRRYVLPYLGQVRLSDLTRNHVQDLVDSILAEDFNASTVRNAIMPLRVIYRRAVQRGDVAINPTHDLNMPAVRGKRDRIATPEKAAALIAALPADLRAVWSTAFYGGLRRGELRGLRWEHVDLAAGVIRVEAGWDSKEGAILPKSRKGQRRVPIPAGLRDSLTEHRMASWQDGYVFGRGPEKVFGATSLTERADRAWKEAGLDRLTLHEARHTYASLMIEAGSQRQGPLRVHGPQLHPNHARPLRPPNAGSRERSSKPARRTASERGESSP
jgi:integrase